MDFAQAVRRRRMVRNYTGEAIPDHLVDTLLDLARRSPSAGFAQGVEFLVLRGPACTARYWDVNFPPQERAGFRWPGLFRAPVIAVPCASEARYRARYAERDKGAVPAAEQLWPVPYWYVDAAFATMTLLLGAADAGLGACFFSVEDPPATMRAFGIPDDHSPIGAVTLGWPAADEPSQSLLRGRRPAGDVIHEGRW